jgi:hypothetical protein
MLQVIRGDTWNLSWKYENGDGTPVDLTGASIIFTMKRFHEGDVIVTDSTAEGVAVDLGEGLISLTLGPLITADLAGQYLYDLEITYPDGSVVTPLLDKISVLKDITT